MEQNYRRATLPSSRSCPLCSCKPRVCCRILSASWWKMNKIQRCTIIPLYWWERLRVYGQSALFPYCPCRLTPRKLGLIMTKYHHSWGKPHWVDITILENSYVMTMINTLSQRTKNLCYSHSYSLFRKDKRNSQDYWISSVVAGVQTTKAEMVLNAFFISKQEDGTYIIDYLSL